MMKRLNPALGLVLLMLSMPVAASEPQEEADATFDALVVDYEQWQEDHNPIRAGRRGDLEATMRWPEASPEAVQSRRAAEREFLDRLSAIEVEALSGIRPESHAVLGYLLRSSVRLAGFEPERMPFVNDSGFFSTPLGVASSTRIPNMAEAEAWLMRLEQLPRMLGQHRVWLERGVADGFVQPAYVVEAVIGQLESIAETPADQSPLVQPFASLPSHLERRAGDRLRQRAENLIDSRVLPAYRELLEFFREDYLAEPRRSIGISEVPDGRDYYRALVRHHTTLDISPEDVHQRGLAEVRRIRAEMEEVIDQTGFEGSFEEFLAYLRSDPRFYAETPRELLMRASYIAKRADDQMPRFFNRLPRLPYGVRPVPDHLAPTYTTGRYWSGDLDTGIAGGYLVNTWRLDQRPLYSLPALTVHEAVPGHHHQIALARELDGLPEFRRNAGITAFVEGWALYTEFLAIEMGIYETPYEHFGRLTYEMWRACRLVVDTGIHYFGWSREQAEACLLENSALARHNVTTEVLRYISWPGQALAYKLGEMLIRELRSEAETRLGVQFDLRDFHDALLEDGAIPLDRLRHKIGRWIDEQETGRGQSDGSLGNQS